MASFGVFRGFWPDGSNVVSKVSTEGPYFDLSFSYMSYGILHKMLLVVFIHHRALSQFSHSTNTGSSKASFSCLGLGRHGVCHGLHCSRELFPILVT